VAACCLYVNAAIVAVWS